MTWNLMEDETSSEETMEGCVESGGYVVFDCVVVGLDHCEEGRISKDGGRCGGRECVAVAVETANFYEVR